MPDSIVSQYRFNVLNESHGALKVIKHRNGCDYFRLIVGKIPYKFFGGKEIWNKRYSICIKFLNFFPVGSIPTFLWSPPYAFRDVASLLPISMTRSFLLSGTSFSR